MAVDYAHAGSEVWSVGKMIVKEGRRALAVLGKMVMSFADRSV